MMLSECCQCYLQSPLLPLLFVFNIRDEGDAMNFSELEGDYLHSNDFSNTSSNSKSIEKVQ